METEIKSLKKYESGFVKEVIFSTSLTIGEETIERDHSLTFEDVKQFKPIEDLTKVEVLKWVTDTKGVEWMQQIEAYLTEIINKQKVIEAEFPWNPPTEDSGSINRGSTIIEYP